MERVTALGGTVLNCWWRRTARQLSKAGSPQRSLRPSRLHLSCGSQRRGAPQRVLPEGAAERSPGVRRPRRGLGRAGASRACGAGAGGRLAGPDPTQRPAAEGLRLSHPPRWPPAFPLPGEGSVEQQTVRPPRLPNCPINKVWSKLPLPGKRRARKLSC